MLKKWYNKNGDNMNFIDNIKKDKYENFVKNHEKSHFLQSYAWGQFAKNDFPLDIDIFMRQEDTSLILKMNLS